jgi:hypothetical protein
VAERYRSAGRREKGRILDELTAVTGWHRKHAVRALRRRVIEKTATTGDPRKRKRRYGVTFERRLTLHFGNRLRNGWLRQGELRGRLAHAASMSRRRRSPPCWRPGAGRPDLWAACAGGHHRRRRSGSDLKALSLVVEVLRKAGRLQEESSSAAPLFNERDLQALGQVLSLLAPSENRNVTTEAGNAEKQEASDEA